MPSEPDPHGDRSVETAGPAPEDANAAMVLVHGRGARASGMLDLAEEIGRDDVAYLAPQASEGSWYPRPFTAPLEANDPHLSSALSAVGEVLDAATDDGPPRERTILLGFSQGACLSLEYAARNARRYGGVVALSGGLIGPDEAPRDYEGSMAGTPVFVGCGDRDPHIGIDRVHESTDVFRNLEADVEERIYEGVGHTVLRDELEYVRELAASVAAGGE